MLDQIELPSLQNLKEVLNLFNLRKLYQYLLYFVKYQPPQTKNTQSTVTSSINSQRNSPIVSDRHRIFEYMIEILNEGTNSNEIIGVQRLIIGMIMLGHIHIFQLIIGQLLPFFIQAIQEDNGNKGFQSQLTKFNQSQIHKPTDKLQIENLDQHKLKMRKKLRQFYKQTFVVLSQWFPKSFYNSNQISWFKKMIQKYDIKCRFIVYYTIDKINEYDMMLKKLKLNGNQGECKQCMHCLQTGGDGYSSSQGILTMRNMPSVIQQQSQSNIQGQYRIQNQKKDRNKTDTSRWTQQTDTKVNNIRQNNQDREINREKSNKIKQLIKRRRQEKKSNLSSDSSINSRRLQKNKSQTLIKRLRENKTSSDYFKIDQNRNTNNDYTTLNNRTQVNQTKLSIYQLRKRLKQKKANNSVGDYYQLQSKRKEKFKSKFRDRQISTKNINVSQSGSANCEEKSLKGFPATKQAFQINQNSKIVFQEDYFKILGFVSKKLFRKQCLKKKKKILNYSSEGITLQITSRLRNSIQLQLKLNFFSEYSQKTNIKLISPLNMLIQQKKNTYIFNFQKDFEPIVMKFNGKELILPILRTEFLQQYTCQWMSKRIIFGNQFQLIFKLDFQVFQDLSYIANLLNLKLIYQNTYQNKFLFFKKPTILALSKHNDSLYRLYGKTQLSNQKMFQLLVKEIKMCLQKRSAKTVKVMKKNSREKSLL